MSRPRFALGWFPLVVVAAVSTACAVQADEAGGAPSAGGRACTTVSCLAGASDAGLVSVSAELDRPAADDEATSGAGAALRSLCGVGCGQDEGGVALYPEDEAACAGAAVEGDGGEGGEGGNAGVLGCSLVAGNDGAPVGVCSGRGVGVPGDPCIAQADCAPGLACVGADGAGQCRPYCCVDPESCPTNTFCAARPLLDRDSDPLVAPLEAPVCVEAHACRLDEPYPCPADQTCTCTDGMACTVVRSDGTTGCVPAPSPGGLEGEACPCSPATLTGPGLICSQTTQTCLALCILGADGASCGEGRRCQSSASLPVGFGICTSTLTTEAQR